MEHFTYYFLGSLCLSIFLTYVWNDLSKTSLIFSKLKYVITILLTTVCLTFSTIFLPNFAKLLVNIFVLILINYMLVSRNLKLAITSVILTEFIIVISELIFGLLYTLFYNNEPTIIYSTYNGILINFIIATISLLMFKFIKALNYVNNLIEYSMKSEHKWIIIYSVFLLLLAMFSTFASYLQWHPIYVLVINMIILCAFVYTTIKFVINEEKLHQISDKYETSISSLKEYEIMIDKFRVDTHENKNEFLTIRNMVKDDPNEAVKYIDKIVNNKIKDNDKIMKQTAKIPKGGLRATIYSKLCLMDKLKIKYTLNIARDVHTTDLIVLDEDLILKICKILGVFLDNAIEAVENLKKKEISIEMYIINNYLCIDISNNFKGNLDLDKISNMKYTTKEEGHGYGLTLVDKILSEEPGNLENEKSINRDTFTQTLKIKM